MTKKKKGGEKNLPSPRLKRVTVKTPGDKKKERKTRLKRKRERER